MIGAALGYGVHAVRAGERDARAQAHPARLRRDAGLHRSARGIRRRDSRGAEDGCRRSRTVLLCRSVQQRLQLAGALRHDRARDHRAGRAAG